MEKELDPDVIKATQSSLGKYVKRPPLNEKLLKKPPFRFLHDIVTTVLKTTGFFEGLFEAEELVSDNVKDRDSKILFLTKVISVVGDTTGISLAVKPSKIVAGQESDRTNELLQCLAQALDKNLSSDEAVKRYKETAKLPQTTDKKSKEPAKLVKKISDSKKLTSTSSEKLTSTKRDTSERSLTRNEKDKSNTVKPKQKENSTIKKESPPKKTSQQTKTITKKNSVEKPHQQNENVKPNKKNITANITDTEKIQSISNTKVDEDLGVSEDKQDPTDSTIDLQHTPQPKIDIEHDKPNTSYTIADNDLNSSLSSQDLMEVDNDKPQENSLSEKHVTIDTVETTIDDQTNKKQIVSSHQNNGDLEVKKLTPHNSFGSNNSDQDSITRDTDKSNHIDTVTKPNTIRPPSVRPSSSRPGAPRLRDKHDNILTGTDNLIVGKVNIIVENAPNEEEEDSSIIIMEQHQEPSKSQEQNEELQLSSNQHGHLVQQILDSQKEFSQVAGKTEIEWQFGAQKAKEALNQEIEQLRFNIQALSRVANPLGKLLDHIQEDVEVMRQELQQWTKTYEETSKELLIQKTANEDSMFPLRTKLKQLDVDIEEKRDKINDLKIVIHKNASRIEKLLTCGNVQ